MAKIVLQEQPISVIGAGSWGTTLANLLAEKGVPVLLWVFEEELFLRMVEKRENDVFLPGVRLSDRIRFTPSLEQAFTQSNVLVCAVPSHAVREVFLRGQFYVQSDLLIVSVTKGLEDQTHFTPCQVVEEVFEGDYRVEVACLSGPSFAREVSRKIPTAVVAASGSLGAARRAQTLFSAPFFRVYTNPDRLGVELAGAMKNVIAIAAGISDGLGLGHSSRAALITRGLAEMTRLGTRMGADPRTFAGLAGLGDLVLTCTGELSRNRQVGLELGKGRKLPEILKAMAMVAEGVKTSQALFELARARKVEMPIAEKVYEVLYGGKDPKESVIDLMSRGLRPEWDDGNPPLSFS